MLLPALLFTLSFLLFGSTQTAADRTGIGINYGRLGSNLPPPIQVAQFLEKGTIFGHVRLFDADYSTIQAFAGIGLAVDVTVPKELIPRLTDLTFAEYWVAANVIPHVETVNISRILVGDEVISTANKTLLSCLVPAMQNLHTALVSVSLHRRIKVSCPQSLGILSVSLPPSSGRFKDGYADRIIKPLLSFLAATDSPFMVNAYPFFGSTADTLDYALFRLNSGVVDGGTNLTYTNMLDAQLDAVYSAMKRLGFSQVDIVVSETGWPSAGEKWEVGVGLELAKEYNRNMIRHIASGIGTPLMPNRHFQTFVFSLFNEDRKPGPLSERNFGLFHADMTPVYEIGILSYQARPAASTAVTKVNKQWCIPKPNADTMLLQENIDYVCAQPEVGGCAAIQPGGSCYYPDSIQAHAAYAMNEYFQVSGRNAFDCDFGQTAIITGADPSYGSCIFRSQ